MVHKPLELPRKMMSIHQSPCPSQQLIKCKIQNNLPSLGSQRITHKFKIMINAIRRAYLIKNSYVHYTHSMTKSKKKGKTFA